MKNTLFVLFAMMFLTTPSFAEVSYEVGDESWKTELLLDTCATELKEAIKYAADRLEGRKVAILPDTIGYQYFNVIFKTQKGKLALPSGVVEYQFQYWTVDDEHTECKRIEPMGPIY